MVRRGSLHFAAAILVLVVFGSNIAAGPSGSGRIAFISDGGGKAAVYVMSRDGSEVSLQCDPPGRLGSSDKIAFSLDGRKIAFVPDSPGECCQFYIMNADVSSLPRLTNPPGYFNNPAFGPDGKRIAFASVGGLYYKQIFVMNLDGSNVTRLTNLRGESFSPTFKPDGKKIAFVSGEYYTSWGIYVMNSDGSDVTRLTNLSGSSFYPVYGPDGHKIAFISGEDYNSRRVYMMNADGSSVNPLTSPMETNAVAFSPDGRKIALSCGGNVCVMNTDGSNMIVLTSGRGPVFVP